MLTSNFMRANHRTMCLLLAVSLSLSFLVSGCEFDEACESEAQEIFMASGNYYIDAYEASRANATAMTQGTGLTLACNYVGAVPWGNVTYEDARNACLDAGKRLCTADEWRAACGQNFPYGSSFQSASCVSGTIESAVTGSKSTCRSESGVYDMSGNLREWVEGGILMGGAYTSTGADELSCTTAVQINDPLSYTPNAGDGFRCCRDVGLLP